MIRVKSDDSNHRFQNHRFLGSPPEPHLPYPCTQRSPDRRRFESPLGRNEWRTKKPPPTMKFLGLWSLNRKGSPGVRALKVCLPPGCQKSTEPRSRNILFDLFHDLSFTPILYSSESEHRMDCIMIYILFFKKAKLNLSGQKANLLLIYF